MVPRWPYQLSPLLSAAENNLGRVDVGTAIHQQLLASLELGTRGDVGEILELDLRFAHGEERVVLVALVI